MSERSERPESAAERSEHTAGADEQPIPIDQTGTRSMLPFLAAAGIIALVVLGIVIAGLVSPAEKNVTDSDRLAVAARNLVGALAADDPLGDRIVCAGFDNDRSPVRIESEDAAPALEFVRLTDARVDGDRATATVTVRLDGTENTSTWNFTRGGNGWVVCDR
ncbi:hypothetical protein IU474_31660 [Nocardia otitidiscaviarum]|uniref:Rv0361 family membrane protein n=1 Tax=Nocardia otitidiscaviarum TaxID=1823 RepID=UPI0018955A11|nr:hypothetical protein [Nocardia otitidiscaviarum]MBF6241602.1 hypothetical protein [Nocardia otitidiscaviarum]